MKSSTIRMGFVAALLMATSIPALALEGNSPCGVPDLTSCPIPVDQTLPDANDMLFWNQADRVIGFRNGFRMYPGDVFKAGTPVSLPRTIMDLSAVSYKLNGQDYKLEDYIKRNSVTGMMVIKDGKVVFEYYGAGNNYSTLWTSRSVGKSVISTLVGIALKEGKIQSLDDLIVKYNPDVKGTVWENVSIKQLLQHTSGVEWNEDYTDENSDFGKLTQCEAATGTYKCVHDLIINPQRKAYAKGGDVWAYSSGGAWLLGDTLELAVGMSTAQYLQEKVWQPYGMVHDGVWQSYEKGKHDVGAHGFNATLEDWGKFGLFVLNNGTLAGGQTVLPDNWVKDASTWIQAKNSVTAQYPEGVYGYEWWNHAVPENAGDDVGPKTGLSQQDTMWGMGIFGQLLTVNQKENLVFVQWSVWPEAQPDDSKQPLEASLMFNAIANTLHQD